MTAVDPRQVAVDYLMATRHDPTEAERKERDLAAIGAADLRRALDDDGARLAFWIDVYNAVVVRYEGVDLTAWGPRVTHFRRTVLTVAGQPLSLDAIEHGILRRSRWKLGLGYLGNPLPSQFERVHRLRRVDPRVHFALNCGAASCPPIAAYRSERIDEQLDLATRSYLATEVVRQGDVIEIPALMLWFVGDFGGAPGIRRFLQRHGVEGWNRPIRFRSYDWTPLPGQWAPPEG